MLELRNLDAGYGGTQVLRGVDLLVPDGSIVALLGPNGAGKTTLLRAASGLISGRMAAEGSALLLVEQYVTRALAAADYVYLLNRVRVSFAGEVSEVDAEAIAEDYVGGGH